MLSMLPVVVFWGMRGGSDPVHCGGESPWATTVDAHQLLLLVVVASSNWRRDLDGLPTYHRDFYLTLLPEAVLNVCGRAVGSFKGSGFV